MSKEKERPSLSSLLNGGPIRNFLNGREPLLPYRPRLLKGSNNDKEEALEATGERELTRAIEELEAYREVACDACKEQVAPILEGLRDLQELTRIGMRDVELKERGEKILLGGAIERARESAAKLRSMREAASK